MSVQFKITTSNYPSTTKGSLNLIRTLIPSEDNTPPESDSFSGGAPSEFYPEGWSVFGNLSVYLESKKLLTSGDAYIYILNNGTENSIHPWVDRLLPRRGSNYTFPIHPWTETTRGDFSRIRIRFDSDLISYDVKMQNLNITYAGVPYKLKIDTVGPGYVQYGHRSENETAISVKAIPHSDKHKFVKWSDGLTAAERIIDPGTSEADIYLTAYFETKTYTVNYYDCSSGQDVLVQSLECFCGEEYYHCQLPDIESRPGYSKMGSWLNYKDGYVEYSSGSLKSKSGKSIGTTSGGKSFTDLTTTDKEVINYYCYLCPFQYKINYYNIKKGTASTLTTEKYFYDEMSNKIDLYSLQSAKKGYVLTNQINPLTDTIDSSITNAWFLNPNDINPENNKITYLLKEDFLQDFNLYQNEIPITYQIHYYNQNELYFIQECAYDQEQSYIDLPIIDNIPSGHRSNPLGWILNDQSCTIKENNNEFYTINNLNSEITQYYGTFKNLKSEYGAEPIKLFFNIYPLAYEVFYTQYIQDSMDNPVINIDYRVFNQNYNTINLPEATPGYKLTNKMTEIDGDEDSSITNLWFIDNTFMSPLDQKINSIEPNVVGATYLYSYEVPGDFEYYFHIIKDNNEIKTIYKKYKYSYSYLFPEITDLIIGYQPIGWYETEQTVEDWYVLNNNSVNANSPTINFNEEYTFQDESAPRVKHYFGYYIPLAYNISYIQYTKGQTSNYTSSTDFRIFGKQYINKNLPTVTKGYKLTNRMTEIDGAENQDITNLWFTSSENLLPTDKKISEIDPYLTEDIVLYSYETPNKYTISLKVLDNNLNEIQTSSFNGYFGEIITLEYPSVEDRVGYSLYGWYTSTSYIPDISDWYIMSNTNTLEQGTIPNYAFGSRYGLYDPTRLDQATVTFYSYYIPYGYYISYRWLDYYPSTDPAQQLPEKIIRIYGKENTLIQDIPLSTNKYIVENEGTINWYYFEIDESTGEQNLLINQQQYIDKFDQNNYDFYGKRNAKQIQITFDVNDPEFGTLLIENESPNNFYDIDSEITVIAQPTEIAYFSNWSDGNNETKRIIKVEDMDMHYTAVFRSNKVYVNTLGILSSYKATEKIKDILIPEPQISYSLTNLSNPYGFFLNENNFYESNNKKIPNSYAVCRITFTAKSDTNITISCINWAESTFDYGIFSKLNKSLSLNSYADSSSNIQKSFSGLQSSSIQRVQYTIPAGTSFIDVKYLKDGSVDSNNDSLQFKINI